MLKNVDVPTWKVGTPILELPNSLLLPISNTLPSLTNMSIQGFSGEKLE